jgi:hypothetical protein
MRPLSSLGATQVLGFAALLAGFQVVRGVEETRSMKRVAPFVERANAAFDDGRQPQVNQALLQLATALQQEQSEWAGTAYGQKLAFELCLTYGRAGRLAAGSEGPRDFALAKPWCKESGQPAVADATKLRATLARVDDPTEGAPPNASTPQEMSE